MVPSLTTRATLAAWSLNGNDTGNHVHDTGNHVNSSASGNASHTQANQGRGVSTLIFLFRKNYMSTKRVAACFKSRVHKTSQSVHYCQP